ncbi:unnamed protein product [Arctogadus glacialis]
MWHYLSSVDLKISCACGSCHGCALYPRFRLAVGCMCLGRVSHRRLRAVAVTQEECVCVCETQPLGFCSNWRSTGDPGGPRPGHGLCGSQQGGSIDLFKEWECRWDYP